MMEVRWLRRAGQGLSVRTFVRPSHTAYGMQVYLEGSMVPSPASIHASAAAMLDSGMTQFPCNVRIQ